MQEAAGQASAKRLPHYQKYRKFPPGVAGVHPLGETAKPRTDDWSLVMPMRVRVKPVIGRGRREAVSSRSGHRPDDFVDRRAPGTPAACCLAFTCRKACRKKSRSACCSPILRSSSAIRRRAATPSLRIALRNGGASNPPLRGRPGPRSASSPPCRTCSCQSYRRRRSIFRSAATADTSSPAATRPTARRLSSAENVLARFISPSPSRNCPLFYCLTLGGHSIGVALAETAETAQTPAACRHAMRRSGAANEKPTAEIAENAEIPRRTARRRFAPG